MIDFELVVLGDWHLALCSAVSFSRTGRKTLLKTQAAGSLQSGCGPSPIREPEFDEFVADGLKRETLFQSGEWKGWRARTWWLAIDTPVDDRDVPDTSILLQVLQEGFQNQEKPELLIVSSQVPLGFCGELQKRFGVAVAYVPENLRLGQGIETFLRADRTVIGADREETSVAVKNLMSGFKTEFLTTNLASAEMVKHATNFFLAMSISYANEVARLGMKFGVDNIFVTSALKADKRIGPFAYVKPGLGFAGGTLPRDLRVLEGLGRELTVPMPMVDAVLKVNEQVDDVIIERIRTFCKGEGGKKVLLMGYSYKADVDTVRRSPAERLAKRLTADGFEVLGLDPRMNGKELGSLKTVLRPLDAISEVPADCKLFVVVTPRPEFKDMKWPPRSDATVFDLHEAFKVAERPAGYRWMELWK